MKRILITGKDSYIGTSVQKYLSQWPDKYFVDTIDVRKSAMGGNWMEYPFNSYDTVYHVAGIAHSDTRNASVEEQALYYSINTELTLNIAKKAKEDGVQQFIFMSSIIVYGDMINPVGTPKNKMKVIKIDTPCSPANFYGDSKKRAEEGLRSLWDKKFKIVILRPPMIYGKGSKGNYPTLSQYAQRFPFFPRVSNQRSMLYITNLCEFVKLMIDNEEDGVFFPQNKSYMNTSELVRVIGRVHGKKVALVPGLTPFLRLAGKIMPLVNKAFGSLVIDKGLSQYKRLDDGQVIDYQIISSMQSIRETEGAG